MEKYLAFPLYALGALSAIAGILGGLGLAAYQCYVWLRASFWVSVSVNSALRWVELPWASAPRDWLGLYKVLEAVPLSLGLPLAGIGVAVLLSSLAGELSKPNQRPGTIDAPGKHELTGTDAGTEEDDVSERYR